MTDRSDSAAVERDRSVPAIVATKAKTMVLILAETAAGYAVFKAKDKALKHSKSLANDLASVENATSMYLPPFSISYSFVVSD